MIASIAKVTLKTTKFLCLLPLTSTVMPISWSADIAIVSKKIATNGKVYPDSNPCKIDCITIPTSIKNDWI